MSLENRIGIVGGGQLGRMMTLDAKRLGFEVIVVDSTPNSPAKQVGAEQIVAPLTDEAATRQLAEVSDFLTFEIEHINTDVLRELRESGIRVNPSPETLETIKDKLNQKRFLQGWGIPVVEFSEVTDRDGALEVASLFGFPFVLKSRFGGYDGRGNLVVMDGKELDWALEKFGKQPLYAERYVRLEKELAIMVARSMSGEIVTYPVVETIHRNNICHIVLAPAPVDIKVYQQAENISREIMRHLKGAGVFGIEMFMTRDGEVLVNELAPRVHNSGHYTIEACRTSQFEQHVRAITGLPLGSTEMTVPAAGMVNILGDRQGKAQVLGLNEVLKIRNAGVHIYGKAETKPERKMGHITVVADSIEEARRNAELARSLISI